MRLLASVGSSTQPHIHCDLGKRAESHRLCPDHTTLPRLIPILILLIASGCAGKGGKAEVLRNDEQGIHVRTKNVEVKVGDLSKFKSELESAPNSEQPSSIDENGNAVLGSVWKAVALDIGGRYGWMLFGGGLIGLFGAAFLFGTPFRKSGMALGAVSGGVLILAMAPKSAIAAVVIGGFLVAVGFGAWRLRSRNLKSARTSAANLKAKGKPDAAVAVLREAKAPEWPIENVKADAAEVKAMVAPPQP
jgi:hypothetical protein